MRTPLLVLAGMLVGWLNGYGSPVFVGMDGQTVEGLCTSPIYNYQTQNSSNAGTPLAVVQNGPEFSADFVDAFGQQWHAIADFQDNYQIVFQFSSPLDPSANIGAGDSLIQWHFTGFEFPIQNLEPVALPSLQNRSSFSFDQQDIWMNFDGFSAYSPCNSYTFQIVPVPEPGTFLLLLVGGGVLVLACRRRACDRVAGSLATR